MKPAHRRTLAVGDRVRYNRWSESAGEGSIFTITRLTDSTVFFRAAYDPPDAPDRHCRRTRFFGMLRSRLLVRIWD